MKQSWDEISGKINANYQFLYKNCSTIVARVMRAGGADKKLNPIQALSYAHNLYWTPKDIAQFCQQLVNGGSGTKHKHSSCPTKKESKFARAIGLR